MLIICVQVSWSFSTGGPCAHRQAARRGSSIRGIKIISKDINFELWPHNVDTDTSLRTMYRLIYAVGAPRWQKYFKSISLGECCVPSVFTIITDNFRHSPSWLRNPFSRRCTSARWDGHLNWFMSAWSSAFVWGRVPGGSSGYGGGTYATITHDRFFAQLLLIKFA